MSEPRVSVIIPVYNREALVGRAVDSVLAQQGAAVELIVVDDGSTDGTPAVLAGYGGKIVHVRQENAGRSAARNAGLERARGELVAWLDSDDAFLEDKVSRQLAFHDANPDLAASAHGTRIVRSDGSIEDKSPRHDPAALRERPYETLMDHFAFFPSVVMAKTDVSRKVGGFSTEYAGGEDMDYVLKIARHAPVGVMPDCLTQMFQHEGQTARRQLADMNVRVLRRHLEELELEPAVRAKLRRKIARYTVSVAKRATSRAELDELLAEAIRVDPGIRFRSSYLRLRWKMLWGKVPRN